MTRNDAKIFCALVTIYIEYDASKQIYSNGIFIRYFFSKINLFDIYIIGFCPSFEEEPKKINEFLWRKNKEIPPKQMQKFYSNLNKSTPKKMNQIKL